MLFRCLSENERLNYEFEIFVRQFVGLLKDCRLLEKDFLHQDSNTLVPEGKRTIWMSDTKCSTFMFSSHKCSRQRNLQKKSSKLQVNIASVCQIEKRTPFMLQQ